MTEACHTSLCNVIPRPAGPQRGTYNYQTEPTSRLGSLALQQWGQAGVPSVCSAITWLLKPSNYARWWPDHTLKVCMYSNEKCHTYGRQRQGNVTSLHERLKLYNYISRNLLTCSQSYHKQISQAEICKSTQWVTFFTSTHMCTHHMHRQCSATLLQAYGKTSFINVKTV